MSVFVSHSTVNEAAVKEIVRILEEAKLDVWHDSELGGGDVWWEQILSNIRRSKVFIIVVSEASVRSVPCLAELSYARALDRTIVPVQIQKIGRDSPNPVSDIQMIPMTRVDQRTSIALISAVYQGQLEARPLPVDLPQPPGIPYGYLQDFLLQIEQNSLTSDAQILAMNMLQENYENEVNSQARDRIAATMLKLSTKPWATNKTIREVEGILGRNARTEYVKQTTKGVTRRPTVNLVPRIAGPSDNVKLVGRILILGGVVLFLLATLLTSLAPLYVLGPLVLIVGLLMALSKPQ